MADLSVTREGITVAAGQRWRSLESAKRGVYAFENGRTKLVGYERIVTITRVADGRAFYASGTVNISEKRIRASARESSIRIDRMHKHATGWELVPESPAFDALLDASNAQAIAMGEAGCL